MEGAVGMWHKTWQMLKRTSCIRHQFCGYMWRHSAAGERAIQRQGGLCQKASQIQ